MSASPFRRRPRQNSLVDDDVDDETDPPLPSVPREFRPALLSPFEGLFHRHISYVTAGLTPFRAGTTRTTRTTTGPATTTASASGAAIGGTGAPTPSPSLGLPLGSTAGFPRLSAGHASALLLPSEPAHHLLTQASIPHRSSAHTHSPSSLPPLRSSSTGFFTAPLSPAAPLPDPAGDRRVRWSPPRRQLLTLTLEDRSHPRFRHTLENANASVRSRLDLPPAAEALTTDPYSVSLRARPPSSMLARTRRGSSSRSDDGSHLSKRRRLEASKVSEPVCSTFRYGHYGQVEPTTLTMEIVSCDGGLYFDGTSYAAENILKHDNSVYCTKGNRCNIVLQHQGSTTFNLQELLIQAPGRNYSSPVREGMVFLSMSKDDLVQLGQYHSQAASQLPIYEARNPDLGAGDPVLASDETGSIQLNPSYFMPRINDRIRAGLASLHSHGEMLNVSMPDSDNDSLSGHSAVERSRFPTNFRVTTEFSDDENDHTRPAAPRGGASARNGRYGRMRGASGWSPSPFRSGLRQRRDQPGEADFDWNSTSAFPQNVDDLAQYDVDPTVSSPISPLYNNGDDGDDVDNGDDGDDGNDNGDGDDGDDDNEGDDDDGTIRDDRPGRSTSLYLDIPGFDSDHSIDGARVTSGAVIDDVDFSQFLNINTPVPPVRFKIEKDRYACKLVFDPPIATRYILLKMWNPTEDSVGNIDIQGVVARGFSGPRFFPSVGLR